MKPSFRITFLLALAVPAAHAALGQKLQTPVANRSSQAILAMRPAAAAAYSVRLDVDEADRQIKQYAAADGTVFAVAWRGKSHPNLSQWLGDYFPAFQRAQRQNRSGLNVMRGQVGSFFVHSYGRMGAFQGLAYDAALLPAGVTPDQLK
ncbi:DUF2844 domain-containing protein [Chromobacterium paludis]|uniref:DUF2844 domain-containing protein n=1 Tax=Chromobacterium paludis TaxID=2605945 RepID=A0A5C1DG97_9NEIS|nr:DUF2844 domain-containing protein [Chromobacterium paludis]QEL55825.1 DUF2844 domain-containing protein [Chromobacterium paludis]